ncbi:MAG: NAD(P)H-hydrate dehydratase [Anaerolineales bacterium]
MKYVSVTEMVAVEKAADQAGHSYTAMMEEAGRGLAEIIQDRYSHLAGKKVLALVGSGNNGGDALVALDYLLRWGWMGSALLLRKRPDGDPLLSRVTNQGGEVRNASDPDALDSILDEVLLDVEVLLDGILGTGVKLPLREPLDACLAVVGRHLASSSHPPSVVAVDCPSGVDCDSGEAAPMVLKADLTVTMAAVKAGLLKFPAYNYVGDLQVVDIGLPDGLSAWEGITREVIEADWVAKNIPPRPLNAHKGTFGTVLVLAGSEQFPGAAILSSRSAYRVGAGLVTVGIPRSIYSALVKSVPEATWIVLEDGNEGIKASAVDQVREELGKPTAFLIGPGWGSGSSTKAFLADVLALPGLPPLVLDADGLRLLSSLPDWPSRLPQGSVLTPHPGEMSVLCGLTIPEIQADRIATAERFAREWSQIVLLKGAHTVIAAPNGQTRILISAEPALARAGSGDVLAGMITGLIAQGMAPFSGAAAGAWLHASAGRIAEKEVGSPAGVLAGDISQAIGQALGDLVK